MESLIDEDYEGKGGIITNFQLNEIIRQMGVNICLIHDINGDKATGFFCKIPYPNDFTLTPVLISNSKILNNQNTQLYKTIKLTLDDNKKSEFYLIIDPSRKVFINDSLGISVIEIKEKDKINKFLDIDDNINKEDFENIYKRRPEIYSLYFKNDENTSYSGGLFKKILDKKIQHSCESFLYSPGAPLLLLSNYKVIGVHTRTIKGPNGKENYEGIFIRYIIEDFKKKFPINKTKNFLLEANKYTKAIIDKNFPKISDNKNIKNNIDKKNNQIGNNIYDNKNINSSNSHSNNNYNSSNNNNNNNNNYNNNRFGNNNNNYNNSNNNSYDNNNNNNINNSFGNNNNNYNNNNYSNSNINNSYGNNNNNYNNNNYSNNNSFGNNNNNYNNSYGNNNNNNNNNNYNNNNSLGNNNNNYNNSFSDNNNNYNNSSNNNNYNNNSFNNSNNNNNFNNNSYNNNNSNNFKFSKDYNNNYNNNENKVVNNISNNFDNTDKKVNSFNQQIVNKFLFSNSK